MSLVVTGVTMPPATATLTTTEVPWTTSPLVGDSSVIFTGVEGRWPSPPTGVGYGVGYGVGVGGTLAADAPDAHAVTPTSTMVRRASNGRLMVQFPGLPIMTADPRPPGGSPPWLWRRRSGATRDQRRR